MHKQYTPQEMADRCLIIREVQNVVGKIAQCDLLADYDLVPQFWSSREDICLGMNNGYFKGAEAVKGYYQQKLENTKKLTARVMEKWADHPNVKGKTADEMYGAGYVKGTDMHTPIIEVAEDGKSAKALWQFQAADTRVTACGPLSIWKICCMPWISIIPAPSPGRSPASTRPIPSLRPSIFLSPSPPFPWKSIGPIPWTGPIRSCPRCPCPIPPWLRPSATAFERRPYHGI